MRDKIAIHFGAGNIGRGFIGPILAQSSFHVVFADIDKELIENLNKHSTYDVHILDGENPRSYPVKDFSGVLSITDDIIHAIAEPEVQIITTSVGVGVLPKIAATIAHGIQQRRKACRGPINVIACENSVGATSQLAKAVDEHLSEEDRIYVVESVGFANCSVDRIVPAFKNGLPLSVGVEEFFEWVVDKNALKRLNSHRDLDIKGMTLTDDLESYVERKLFTLNTGHAIAAYLGLLNGYETIDQSVRDEAILQVVRGAMHESGSALLKKHTNLKEDEHIQYIRKIEGRFKNRHIDDHVKRVGRDPLRKLSKSDRLSGPTAMARQYGLPIDNLVRGIAAALLYVNEEDKQSMELQKKISDQGIETTVEEVTGFKEGHEENAKIVKAYHELNGGQGLRN